MKPTFVPAIDPEIFDKFIREHQLSVEILTEGQLAEAFRQALASGDFMRYVQAGTDKQAVIYLPYREAERLRSRIAAMAKLLDSVLHDDKMPLLGSRECSPACPACQWEKLKSAKHQRGEDS